MKVEVNEPEANEIDFPKLMIITADVTDKGMIVLMRKYEEGTVVREGKSYTIGFSTDSWCMEDFSEFKGSITLSND